MKLINKTKLKKKINYIIFNTQDALIKKKENYKNVYIYKMRYD